MSILSGKGRLKTGGSLTDCVGARGIISSHATNESNMQAPQTVDPDPAVLAPALLHRLIEALARQFAQDYLTERRQAQGQTPPPQQNQAGLPRQRKAA